MVARPSRPALGRGLSALLGDMTVAPPGTTPPAGTPPATTALTGLRQIPVDLLDPNPFQPRAAFDPEALEELAASIRAHGVLQPILARVHPTRPDRFAIIAGERRWRAAALAGLHEVPAFVRDMTNAEAGIAALIENLQREDLNAIEEAEGYSRLLDELELTQEKLAETVGKSRTHVTNILRLLNLPPGVQTEVRKGSLSAGHARALLAHPDPEALAATVFKNGLTVRQTEALAARAASGTRKPGDRRSASADAAALEQRLAERLGFKARVSTGRQGRVSVVLDFSDVHQLEAWMDRLEP